MIFAYFLLDYLTNNFVKFLLQLQYHNVLPVIKIFSVSI